MPPTPRPVLVLALLLAALPVSARAQDDGAGRGAAPPDVPSADTRVTPAAARFWIALDQPLSMPFHDETPLEDLLKYVQFATQGPDLPSGLTIYVDPAGLREAECTMQSPVRINLEGVPLAATLRLALNQLDLGYRVVPEGFLLITSRNSLRDSHGDAIARELAALRQEVVELRARVAELSARPASAAPLSPR